MSRLVELLLEKAVDGSSYTKYTPPGNLFRLMMITNPDHPIPQKANRSLVGKMLADLEDKTKVKKLQTLYNLVNKSLQAGKNPKVADKKNYFTALFELLLPMTNDKTLMRKTKTLAGSFASGGEKTLGVKRKSALAIGRALLGNKELQLNSQDKAAIKDINSSFEQVLGDEVQQSTPVEPEPKVHIPTPRPPLDPPTPGKTTKDNEQGKVPTLPPVPPIADVDPVKKKVRETPTSELQKTSEATAEILKAQSKNPQEASVEDLKSRLSNNTTADVFHVDLKGDNEFINKEVNQFITETYDKVRDMFDNSQYSDVNGTEYANMAMQFISDTFKNLDSAKIEKEGRDGSKKQLNMLRMYWGRLKDNIEIKDGDDGDVTITFSNGVNHIQPDHPEVLNIQHTLMPDRDGEKVVEVDYVQIPASAQGGGISKRLFKDSLKLYEAQGVDKIELTANIDVGGYAWFRYGFVPKDQEQLDSITQWMDNVIPSIEEALAYDTETIADHIEKHAKTMTPEVQNLLDLFRAGTHKRNELKDVLNIVIGRCSVNFEIDYDDPSKYKQMSQDVAVKNSEPVEYNGKKYSIPYKSLLSINSVRDEDGYSAIPLLYQGRNNALDWKGQLDMKDLDATYAYLGVQKK